MSHRTWSLRSADPAIVEHVQHDHQLHPVLARILVGRGLHQSDELRGFLEPRLSDLAPPDGMAGIEVAAERLAAALVEGELIGVFGDYDLDGVSSTALLGGYLRRCGGRLTLRVARRDEGYGFGEEPARELVARGCAVLTLLDCGTSDHSAVALATEAGVDVIAVDHHQVTDSGWPGLVLVNPQRPDCHYPFKGLAAVGLTFFLVARLRRHLQRRGVEAPDPRPELDLVALGTVADVAPLERENRILVARGLELLGRTQRPGLRELIKLCNVPRDGATAADVGWRLGPRLNAPGRLDDASIALDCLLASDVDRAVASARRCEQINAERRAIQDGVEAPALEQGQRQVARGRSFVLVAGEGWHPGVIGIVASKLVSALGRPAAVVALEGAEGRGSARSVPGLDLVSLLQPCADLLVRFGGHAAAAGFAVQPAAMDALGERLDELTATALEARQIPALDIDAELELAQIDRELCLALRRLMPHGAGNPAPILAARDLTVASARCVGRDSLALRLRAGDQERPAIGFGMSRQMPDPGERVDVAFVAEIDDYRPGEVRMRVVELRRHASAPQE